MPAGDQSEVIAFLSHPESYGLAEPVAKIETHAAIVFLAGEHAFKLKRAVRYPYLDFSTPELRRAVCEEELRLNRRTAPEIYLAVRSVNRQADGSYGFAPGEPVDWLVEMRRFGQDQVLDAVAERGELTPALTRRLADRIAEFHASAEVVAGGSGAERLRAAIDKNRASLKAHPDILASNMVAQFDRRMGEELARTAPLLDRRAAEGKVRHCHGDLHLANICLWHGEPTLFDCLEFDPELATIDVLYDIAFLIMDLSERGMREAASLVFNRYCDMTGEGEGIAALPLFLSVRAAIRAHVAATVAAQAAEADRAETKTHEAREYLAAALAFLDRPPPRLVAVGGLSGTGKSTLAGALAPGLGGSPGARWLRTDVLRKRMAGLAPEDELPGESYTAEASARVYARLAEEARVALAAGSCVVVDGVYADPAERTGITALAGDLAIPFTGLWLEAGADVLMARVTDRRGDPSDATPKVVEAQLARDPGDIAPWHRLDASQGPEAVLAAAKAVLV